MLASAKEESHETKTCWAKMMTMDKYNRCEYRSKRRKECQRGKNPFSIAQGLLENLLQALRHGHHV